MIASKGWVKDLVKKCFKKQTTYSTDETRVGTWIDGKPVYRKVYILPSDITNYTNSTLHIAFAVDCKCYFMANNQVLSSTAYVLNNTLYVNANGDNFNMFVLEYTKTTD